MALSSSSSSSSSSTSYSRSCVQRDQKKPVT
ncbi:BnaA02g13800D [Brassica napus]|uniref:BnaA02g13800D protein n=1 Tax=Brassica napus TaxID=3708 RepID=A0A078I4D2_BRANA|nr:BnaA02g13800D [Brassica napus]